MAVDARLLASIGQNMPSPTAGVENAYKLKDLMNREQASSLGLESAKSGIAQDAAIKSIAEKADLSTSEGQMQFASGVAKIDPKRGMDAMRWIQDMQSGKLKLEEQQLTNLSTQNDLVGQTAGALTMEYDSLVAKGMPPAQAAAQMQPKYLQTIQSLAAQTLPDGSPVLTKQHKEMLAQNAMFNPDAVRGWAANSAKGREALQMQIALRGSQRADAQLAEDKRANDLAAGAAQSKAAAEAKQKALGTEEGLRKELTSLAKPFVEVRDAYSRLNATAKNPSPAGDLGLIFNYQKMLDPGSVVRESEFAQAAATGAYGERIKAQVSRVMNGERLSDVQRADFVKRAGDIYEAQKAGYSQTEAEFRRVAKSAGVNADNVVIDLKAAEPTAPGAPAAKGWTVKKI